MKDVQNHRMLKEQIAGCSGDIVLFQNVDAYLEVEQVVEDTACVVADSLGSGLVEAFDDGQHRFALQEALQVLMFSGTSMITLQNYDRAVAKQ